MSLNRRYALVFLLLCSFSCSDRPLPESGGAPSNTAGSPFLVNAQGDTLAVGTPIPLQLKEIDPNAVNPITYTPLKEAPSEIPAHRNVIPAGRPTIRTVPDPLPQYTPGEQGVSQPKKVPAKGKMVVALQPEPILAQTPTYKENALYDIRNLDVEEGLKASSIYTILEDSRHNFWFGALGGGVSRYDGTRFLHFTTREGLINDDVISSAEDRFGNLWFGTWGGGVCRYDGQHFVHYSTKEGLSGNEVWVIFKDSREQLWIGTNGGLSLYHPPENDEDAYFTNYTKENGLSANVIRAIVEDERGRLWIGTAGGGVNLLEFNNGSARFTHLTSREGLGDDVVWSLAIDGQGHLWVGTYSGGINRYDGQEIWAFTREQGLSSNEIWAMATDHDGKLWLGTEGGGTIKYEPTGPWGTFTQITTREGLSRNIVLSLRVDSEGTIWSGTSFDGINQYRENGFMYFNMEKGLLNNEVRSIMEDREGNIWIGTWGGGISRYDGQQFSQLTTEQGLNSNYVAGIAEDHKGTLWFCTNAGVQAFDGNRFLNISEKEGLVGDRTILLFEDESQHIWISTVFDGMNRYFQDPTSGKHELERLTTAEGLASDHIWAASTGGNGQIWIGTWGNGLGQIIPATDSTEEDQIIYYTSDAGLVDNEIWSLFQDSWGILWVGTNNGLSYIMTNADELSETTEYGASTLSVSIAAGFNDQFITSILEDQQKNLWISTQKEVFLLRPDQRDSLINGTSGQTLHLFSLGQEDGLKKIRIEANGDNAMIDSQNRIWWGSTDGISVLDLNKFQLPQRAPNTPQLDYLALNQQYVSFRKLQDSLYRRTLAFGSGLDQAFDSIAPFYNYPLDLELPYRVNSLTFNFSSVDWQGPHHLKYSYFLEGLDDQWSPATAEPGAIYRSLPAGDYTFKVKAIGAAGKWSEPFVYSFTIRPPWWQTGWAYSIYALILLTILAGLYLYQRRRWMLQNKLDMEQEKAKRLEELDHFKNRFYTNITHEFRTPLTVIKGMSDQITEDQEVRELIQRNSDHLLQMVNQLLDLSKLESKALQINWVQGDIIAYLEYLTESCHSLADNKHLNLAFFSQEESLLMDYDEHRLQQILINLLGNAIKFTPEYGSVKVIASRINRDDLPHLHLQVKDTGRGIPAAELPNIFDRFYQVDTSATRQGEGTGIGLALVKELVHLLRGRIEVKSTVNKGTTFDLFFPIHREAKAVASAAPRINGLPAVGNAPIATRTTGRGKDERPLVLVIEDNADVITYICSCLRDLYRVDTASSGKEGLQKALKKIPDVILSDVMMPEMDGLELCRHLKTDRLTSHIPIILLTARATQEDKIRGLSEGADAYLTKPFDKRELLIRLEQLARLSKQLREALADPDRNSAPASPQEQREAKFLQEVDEIIEAHLADELFDTNRLCRAIAMSRAQLHRKLKAVSGRSTAQYIRIYRLQHAKKLLKNTELPIGEIAQRVGFKDFSHFSRSFAREFGRKPSETRI